jgi:hypothetical protein
MSDIRARKRQILTGQLEALWQDYEAAIKQIGMALGATERNRLQREADDIYGKIEQLDSEIKSLELAPAQESAPASETGVVHRLSELQSKLPEIDFKAVEDTLQSILRDYQDDGCAALFLFQQSTRMGGEWCAARIRELLRRETRPGQFRHIAMEFQFGGRTDNMALLRRLGQELGAEATDHNLQSFLQLIIQKLCGSLQSGSIILIECRRCDYLSREPGLFQWVMGDFWESLVRGLAKIAQEFYEIKVIMLLFVDGRLPQNCLTAEQCCTLEQFQKDRLLEISLEPWTREDIRTWIARYAGLSLPRADIDFMADKIYGSTNGDPTLVAHALLQECCPAVAG